MSDIIERLLTRTDYADREEAADEIMRLRAALEKIAQHDLQAVAIDALRTNERKRSKKAAFSFINGEDDE